jgi:hypothetical protein
VKLVTCALNLIIQLEEGIFSFGEVHVNILGRARFTCLRILFLVRALFYKLPYSEAT